jgi:aspartyl aminopeptidase
VSVASVSNPSVFSVDEQALAQKYLNFVNKSPSQFHAVAATAEELLSAGYVQVSEKQANWGIKAGGKYFYTRNQSSITAFAVGQKWVPGNGFTITAAHTDSPVLKLKPVTKVQRHGYLQVGVEPYGGGLWHTWSVHRQLARCRGLGVHSHNVRADAASFLRLADRARSFSLPFFSPPSGSIAICPLPDA